MARKAYVSPDFDKARTELRNTPMERKVPPSHIQGSPDLAQLRISLIKSPR